MRGDRRYRIERHITHWDPLAIVDHSFAEESSILHVVASRRCCWRSTIDHSFSEPQGSRCGIAPANTFHKVAARPSITHFAHGRGFSRPKVDYRQIKAAPK